MLSISEVAQIFEVSYEQVESWVVQFAEYLSVHANSQQEVDKGFTQEDIQILAVVFHYWEENSDYENISALLDSGLYREDVYRKFSLLNTSIIQDPTDEQVYEGNETWTQGFLVGDRPTKFHHIEIARSYKLAADNLISEIRNSPSPLDYAYPILFLYRHCLELYLKAILNDSSKRIHFLDNLVEEIERKYNNNNKKKFPAWMKLRLLDFHSIDPRSTSFRYIENATMRTPSNSRTEGIDSFWVDFEHLNLVINSLCSAFEDLSRNMDLDIR